MTTTDLTAGGVLKDGAIVAVITAQDKRCLKHADSVVFQLHEGQAAIRAIKRGENTATGFDQEHKIYCATTMADYRRDASINHGHPITAYTAFYSSLSVQFDHDLRTLFDRIRAGVTLTLAWTRSNNNQNNDSVGWHRDELRLVITDDKGKREVYLVEVQVGPNNSARMIQRR